MASLVVQGLRLHSQCRKPGLDPWAGNKIPNATVEIEDPICCKSLYNSSYHVPSPILNGLLREFIISKTLHCKRGINILILQMKRSRCKVT